MPNAERRGVSKGTIKPGGTRLKRRRRRSYISSPQRNHRSCALPSSFRPLSGPRCSPARPDPGTKAASFEGGSETKKKKEESANTACNRVNCAPYAFISLFRDNLLIVSTKRDTTPCSLCNPGRFFGGGARETFSRKAERINLYAGERSPFLSPVS